MLVRTSKIARAWGLPRATLAPALLVLLAGCGPEAPQAAGPAAPPAPPKPAKVAIEEDRTPVDAVPPGLFLQVHTLGPRAVVQAVKAYLPSNAPPIDPRYVVRELTQDIGVDRIVDIDRPVDLALVLPDESEKKDAEPKVAVAFGVEDDVDVDAAMKGIAKVEPTKGGVLRLVSAGGPLPCVVVPALGPAKRRLVCSPNSDPMELGPWLARGVTRAKEPAAPLHAELAVAPLRKRYEPMIARGRAEIRAAIGPEVKLGFAEIDKVLKRTALALVDETFDFLDDLDAMTLDVTLPNEGVALGSTFSFGGTKSWTARALVAGGDAPGAVPAKLGGLPGDGWFAGFARATSQSDALMAPFQAFASDVVVAMAADFKWPAKDKDLALDVVKYAFPAAADGAFVSGEGPKGEAPKADDVRGKLAKALAAAALRRSWTLGVAERDPKAAIALGKAMTAWITRPSFADAIRSLTHDRLGLKLAAKPLTAKELPKGAWAQRYDLEVFAVQKQPEEPGAKKGAKQKPKETSIGKVLAESLIVPDGNRTWSAWGQNLAAGDLIKRLVSAMEGKDAAKVSGLPGFGFATQGAPSSGGFMVLSGLAHTVDRKGGSEDLLQQLPDKGRGAFVWRVVPGKSRSDLGVLVPRDVIVGAFTWLSRG